MEKEKSRNEGRQTLSHLCTDGHPQCEVGFILRPNSTNQTLEKSVCMRACVLFNCLKSSSDSNIALVHRQASCCIYDKAACARPHLTCIYTCACWRGEQLEHELRLLYRLLSNSTDGWGRLRASCVTSWRRTCDKDTPQQMDLELRARIWTSSCHQVEEAEGLIRSPRQPRPQKKSEITS